MTETFRIFPVRSNASLNVIEPIVKKLAFLAHSTVSNLAPVRYARFIHVAIDSSQALILSARAGTSISLSSSSVRVHVNAATVISSVSSSQLEGNP